MDIETLAKQLPDLRSEAARLRDQENDARQKAENLERIIEGIEGLRGPSPHEPKPRLFPEPATARSHGMGLRGIGAVRRVMLEQPERIWAAREIHSIMESRDWISPSAKHPLRGTEAAINRLTHSGEIEKVRPGRYRVTDQIRRDDD